MEHPASGSSCHVRGSSPWTGCAHFWHPISGARQGNLQSGLADRRVHQALPRIGIYEYRSGTWHSRDGAALTLDMVRRRSGEPSAGKPTVSVGT